MEWDSLKENAGPLARGRNAATLSNALKSQAQAPTKQLDHIAIKSNNYEEAVKTCHNTSDPLNTYLTYINFIEQNNASDTRATFLLYERATRAFLDEERYLNDVRYVRVAITYADKTSTPLDVFKFLHKKSVGSTSALFWIAWAWVAEKTKDFKLGDKIFKKATSKSAEPKKMLTSRYRQFQRRMSKHFLKTAEDAKADAEAGIVPPLRQPALSTLRGVRNPNGGLGLGVGRGGNPQANALQNATNRGGMTPTFDIFVEDEDPEGTGDGMGFLDDADDPGAHPRATLETEKERFKENTQRATRWNEGGLGNEGAARSRLGRGEEDGETEDELYLRGISTAEAEEEEGGRQAFEVFVDPSTEPPRAAKAPTGGSTERPGRTGALGSRDGEGAMDKLAKDPLRYVRNPEKEEKDRRGGGGDKADPAQRGGQQKKEKTKEKEKEKINCGFSKRLVAKGSDGQE
ncbi:hypothetical protein TrRE_jg13480, partial [Triparma retinervis]